MVLRSGDEDKSNGVDFSSSSTITSLNDLHRKMSLTLTLTSDTSTKMSFSSFFLLEKVRGKTDGDFKEANWRSLTMAEILVAAAFFDQLLSSTMFDIEGTTAAVDLHGFFLGYIGKPFDDDGVHSSLRKSLSIIGRRCSSRSESCRNVLEISSTRKAMLVFLRRRRRENKCGV